MSTALDNLCLFIRVIITEITEVNLPAFVYRLFHEDLSLIIGYIDPMYLYVPLCTFMQCTFMF